MYRLKAPEVAVDPEVEWAARAVQVVWGVQERGVQKRDRAWAGVKTQAGRVTHQEAIRGTRAVQESTVKEREVPAVKIPAG